MVVSQPSIVPLCDPHFSVHDGLISHECNLWIRPSWYSETSQCMQTFPLKLVSNKLNAPFRAPRYFYGIKLGTAFKCSPHLNKLYQNRKYIFGTHNSQDSYKNQYPGPVLNFGFTEPQIQWQMLIKFATEMSLPLPLVTCQYYSLWIVYLADKTNGGIIDATLCHPIWEAPIINCS